MSARRAARAAKSSKDREAEVAAHRAVDGAKRALGERVPVCWQRVALRREMLTPQSVQPGETDAVQLGCQNERPIHVEPIQQSSPPQQSLSGHSGHVSPIESKTSPISAAASSPVMPAGGS